MSNLYLKRTVQDILESVDIKINGERPWDIVVRNEAVYDRVIKNGSVGAGESYMDGEVSQNTRQSISVVMLQV